jgi:hypothetical protein
VLFSRTDLREFPSGRQSVLNPTTDIETTNSDRDATRNPKTRRTANQNSKVMVLVGGRVGLGLLSAALRRRTCPPAGHHFGPAI